MLIIDFFIWVEKYWIFIIWEFGKNLAFIDYNWASEQFL